MSTILITVRKRHFLWCTQVSCIDWCIPPTAFLFPPCEGTILLYLGTEIRKQISSFLAISFFFLIARYLLYNIVQVSAIHQHESAREIHIPLPLEPPISHPIPRLCVPHRLLKTLCKALSFLSISVRSYSQPLHALRVMLEEWDVKQCIRVRLGEPRMSGSGEVICRGKLPKKYKRPSLLLVLGGFEKPYGWFALVVATSF